LDGRRILLIISGGIAAYKSLDLIRRLKERGAAVRCILTQGGAQFITPLSVETLSGERAHWDLFSLTEESEMGHLSLSREADLVVVAPASADILAKMAAGIADDLATTALLASDKPLLVAPAMNTRMWNHPATQRNLARLESTGAIRVGPEFGDLAEGEVGKGRMAEPDEIVSAIEAHFAAPGQLSGVSALVTSGPTHEAIDPVRYLANRSSGKQGHAIAGALARLGAGVTLVSGPSAEADPVGVRVVHVVSAEEMLGACLAALPVDVAVCAAAVSDWRVAEASPKKLKKGPGKGRPNRPLSLELVENPDILASLSAPGEARPRLVVGFAAETENLVENARIKLAEKGCDWILANDVSPEAETLGGEINEVHLIIANGGTDAARAEHWPPMSKTAVARRLALRVAEALPVNR
ncbi:MAG: bifunctional phosphopantothenoylcysteine decarboxylase/phosphopantothenate--cysteine ligase CoaBC, partial [Alphaproteobacteria bacterium]